VRSSLPHFFLTIKIKTIMKATKEQMAEWQKTHGEGNIFELSSAGKLCYVFSPATNLRLWKLAVAARRKSVGDLVDAILNNCWLAGDPEFKTSDDLKLGIESIVDEMVDTPDHEIEELENGNLLIKVGEVKCEVRKATRMDIRYAEDRNKDNKPFDTQIHLLERIAVSKLDDIRNDVKIYISILLVMNSIRDEKHVEIKKF
jgi:hypothetical protein